MLPWSVIAHAVIFSSASLGARRFICVEALSKLRSVCRCKWTKSRFVAIISFLFYARKGCKKSLSRDIRLPNERVRFRTRGYFAGKTGVRDNVDGRFRGRRAF